MLNISKKQLIKDAVLLIFLSSVIFAAFFLCLYQPDWKTVDTKQVTAHSGLIWNISDRYKPNGMDVWAYIYEIKRLNPNGVKRGEIVIIPICEVRK